ncbi:MAG: serine/threonine protein kinase, partial [Acidimicrobiia bacterium]
MEVVVESAELGTLPPATLLRLQSEASQLRHLDNPYLAPALDVGWEARRTYVVLPRVPLGTLAGRLRSDGPLALTETLGLGRCVLSALCSMHRHGVVHTAIRPDHVFLGPPRDGTAVLGGFGIARVAQFVGSASDEPITVLRYLSPEQAGLTAREVDERSDLYSTGLLLFESLSGRPAFVADNASGLLRQHLSRRAPTIRALGIGVPRIIDEFLQRLLRKDPTDRYQSSGAALDDLEEISSALARGEAEPTVALGSTDCRTSLTQPVLVGREEELGALESHVGRAKVGRAGLVLLEGQSGAGKTRLLDELALRSAVSGLSVF